MSLPLGAGVDGIGALWLLSSARPGAAQKYTIRDLNTGQLFVVDGDPSPAMEALARGPPGSPTAAEGPQQQLVTDVSSGREMSLEEFDRALGLHSALEVCMCRLNSPHWSSWGVQCQRSRLLLGAG